MDFYSTTAQFTEAAGFDYSKYYIPMKGYDGKQLMTLISRDGRSFYDASDKNSPLNSARGRRVGNAIVVTVSYGAETKMYVRGKSGKVLTKTINTSEMTDDAIKSNTGWNALTADQIIHDQVANRVAAGVFLQPMYERHARKEVITNIAKIVKKYGDKYGVRLGTCAEPAVLPGISLEGCLSVRAINEMLGTSIEDKGTANNNIKSRPLCSCYGGKTDILAYDKHCASSCTYCYAHHNSNAAALLYNKDGSLRNIPLTTTRKDTEKFDDTDIDSKFIYHCKGK